MRDSRGIKSLIRSFYYAGRGLKWVLASQRNMRIHLLLTAVALGAAAWFGISTLELALVFFAIALVTVAEMINSAVEKAVDLVTADFHPLAGMAKDAAAGAVLLAAFFSVIIGLLVFFPYVKKWLLDIIF